MSDSPGPLRGFRGTDACHHARISYRQLDYWARTDLVVPTVRPAHGSGSQRLYSRTDVIDLALVKAMLDAGCSLQLIRSILPEVRRSRATRDTDVAVSFTSDYVTVTIDAAALAARIPEPPDEPGTEGVAEPFTPTLTLVP